MTQSLAYRPDIQVIRALAVTLVILFHADPTWMPGGFLGVDIFFTISGFIIFRQINHEIRQQRFTLSNFYRRRIIRLFPALIATITVTLLLSLLLLPLTRLEEIFQSAIWSIVSLSNVFFYFDAGYFSADAILKPLLHLWSLGVEEQFYLVFPVLVMLASRGGTRALAVFFATAIVLGTWLNVHSLAGNPDAAFFLSPQRFYQFTVGAFVVLLPRCRLPGQVAGVAWTALLVLIIIACVWFYNEHMPLPGWRVLPLALVIALVLYLGESVPNNQVIIRNRLVRFLGNASYSLYLAHWPVVVFLYYRLAGGNPTLIAIVALALGIISGAMLYALVEQPFRKKPLKPVLYTFVSAVLVVCVPVWLYLPKDSAEAEAGHNGQVKDVTSSGEPGAVFPAGTKVILMGDSHAGALQAAIRGHMEERKLLQPLVAPDCPPLAGMKKIVTDPAMAKNSEYCGKLRRRWRQALRGNEGAMVIMASRWELLYADRAAGIPDPRQDWLVPLRGESSSRRAAVNLKLLERGLRNTLKLIGERDVLLIGNVPSQYRASVQCAIRETEEAASGDAETNRRCGALATGSARAHYSSTNALLERFAASHDNVFYVDPMAVFCNDDYCQLVRNGKVLYRDDNHLGFHGAGILVEYALTTWRRQVSQVSL